MVKLQQYKVLLGVVILLPQVVLIVLLVAVVVLVKLAIKVHRISQAVLGEMVVLEQQVQYQVHL